ncbi:5-oxoprolinase subunit B family protein [Gordonia hydrophobica]|uniref:Carboxyltransferase domain-containing protein n=1 Tax=Gordonia hydrophobica TaxID=40516 RepID=A0ABZ2U3N3_9ACTN|nr:carboxyltransferase domain-containing protein [Gordonia hydrophobica]MBM7367474.1 KipI family sensor histidine kinase inhibitor [Gordonia hydrophobica]
MRELPAGSDAVLLDFSTGASPETEAALCARALRTAVDDGRLPRCDVVLSAETILIEALPGTGLDQLAVYRIVHEARREFPRETTTSVHSAPGGDGSTRAELDIAVVYDGADLTEAAHALHITPDRLIDAHQSVLWRVQFMGFAPGFGYLIPDPSSNPDDCEIFQRITRRTQSRPAVPTGSVAVAAGYSAVYPRSSPGGWYLLGHTTATMWDSSATPPALLTAGMTVRFHGEDVR